MTNLEQLFIRACKSEDPLTRLRSVRRRFYIVDYDHDLYLMETLADICDKYSLVTVHELLYELDRSQSWKYGISSADTHHLACVKVLVSKIRLTERGKFPGLSMPTRIKKIIK